MYETILLVTLLGVSTHATQIILEENSNHSHLLTCSSDNPWFICVWESPSGERLCSVQGRDGQVTNDQACGDGDGHLSLHANITHCSLSIETIGLMDTGTWTCALTDHNMDTTKHHSSLDVIMPGHLWLGIGDTDTNSDNDIMEEQIEHVELFDGDRVELRCQLDNVWPVNNLSWSFSQNEKVWDTIGAEMSLDIQYEDPVVTSECEYCSVSVHQRIHLTVHQQFNGLMVACSSKSQQDAVVFSVKPILTANSDQLKYFSKQLGLWPGIVISVIFILLSLAILVSFCIRGSRRRKSSISSETAEDHDAELGRGLVENDIIKDKDAVENIIENVYDEDDRKDNSVSENSLDSSDSNTSDSLSSDTSST